MDKNELFGNPCAGCGEKIPSHNYLQYFVQKYDAKRDRWFFISKQELIKSFGEDPNFPKEIKESKLPYVAFCTRACIKSTIDYLNGTNTGQYRWNTKYYLIRSKAEEREEE